MSTLDTTPTIIGHRYHIHETLGRGGMGLVYRATDMLTNEVVAVKQVAIPDKEAMPITALSDAAEAAFRVALAREFRTLASLRHPNIISVLDYGFSDDRSEERRVGKECRSRWSRE